MMRKREVWIDNVKVIACILVVLGHFFQSMVKTSIIEDSYLYEWFNQTIYFFHVPLFFICSGYLYQKFSRVYDIKSWGNNVVKKVLNLGIPYFIFSIITLVLKKMFEGSVNTMAGDFFTSLFITPIAPYWYLYVLFFIFLVTPTIKSHGKMIFVLIIVLIMKLFIIFWGEKYNFPYMFSGLLNNEIWFVFGMCMSMFELKKKLNTKTVALGVLFLALSIYIYTFNISFKGMSFLLGVLGCISVISIVYNEFKENKQNKVFGILAKYTLPIFVMHTIFAACFRSILLKFGVTSAVIHILLGLIVSFICPIIAAWVMRKTIFLDVLLYPTKYIMVPKLGSISKLSATKPSFSKISEKNK